MKETKKIPPEYSRRFVISDVHGCAKTLEALVHDQMKLQKADQLFFLGDYIDRGPDSKRVIDFILDLQSNGFQVFTLMGNHESDLIELSRDEPRFLLWHARKNNLEGMLAGEALKPVYMDFLNKLDLYYELDNCFLVHAGFNFNSPEPFKDKTSMLWIRDFEVGHVKQKGKSVIHGHDPTYLDAIRDSISFKRLKIPLDNGAVYNKKHKIFDKDQLGNLCALNIDTHELLLQPNIE